jgi:ribosome-binding protein aMBF1 (putative translation factor)
MGIAQRTVAVKYEQKLRGLKRTNALVANAKSLGDLIRIRREVKNLTPSHLAAKMGIAASVVYSWEENTHRPDCQQLADLSYILKFNFDEFKMLS